jgi:hypothetical protein
MPQVLPVRPWIGLHEFTKSITPLIQQSIPPPLQDMEPADIRLMLIIDLTDYLPDRVKVFFA